MLNRHSDTLLGTESVDAIPGLRLDRAISVRLVHPISKLLHRRSTTRIPILMYHGITKVIAAKHRYFETNTPPELFALHMKYLHENGYRCVSLCQAVEALKCPPGEERLAVITFDDGYRDFYTDAFPVLRKYAFGATMFIASGHTGDRPICLEGKEFMTWEEVREILVHGIEVGSHTVSHPQLCGLSEEMVSSEIGNSKQAIEDKLGCSVVSFSYPFAFPEHDRQFIRLIRELLQMHGYKNGVCTTIGTASREHDVFFLPRLPANAYDDLKFYQAKLEGSYDWLRMAQTLYKQIVKPMILTPFEQLMETVF